MDIAVERNHKPLVSIWHKTFSNCKSQAQAPTSKTSPIRFGYCLPKRKENVIVDALSRVSPKREEEHNSQELEVIPVHYITSIVPADSDRLQEYKVATQNDRLLSLLIHEVYHGKALQMTHEGHNGGEKSLLRAREAVFWPRITLDIINEVQSSELKHLPIVLQVSTQRDITAT